MAATMGTHDASYIGLLGLAETFRTSNPPKIRQCIQCLQSVFQFQPSPAIQARTHLQLGKLLHSHTQNTDMGRSHLEKAVVQAQSLGTGFEDIHLEAMCILTDIYKEQGQFHLAKSSLRQALEVAHASILPFWQFKITFQLADVHTSDKELKAATEVLEMGERFAEQCGSHYMKCLFALTRAMAFMMIKELSHTNAILSMVASFLERWNISTYQRESIQVFYLLLKVWNFLTLGQAKGVRPHLKQLQQSIQILTTLHMDESQIHEAERFEWLTKEHLCVLVYLVTVMHSMYAGYMEKAIRYSEKALVQVDRLKSTTPKSGLLSTFKLVLLEHMILCRMVQGQMPQAIKEISQVYQFAQHDGKFLTTHQSVLHTLLALYAMSMNLMDSALTQFNTALETCSQPELRNFIGLNLAIVYIRSGVGGSRSIELQNLLAKIRPDQLPTCSHSHQAGYYYIRGLQSFFESRFMDAKKYLRETLKIANSEDLNRLTACSLVLLGNTFLSQGITQEALDMALPANQLASRIPDSYIHMWAASLLRDLYGVMGDPVSASEYYQLHNSFTKRLLDSHMQASQMPEHRLIEWVGGISPPRQSATKQTAGLLTTFPQAGPSSMM
ncbi:MAU2 chromatid cohesion factor homolog [Orbicella faveolata]|uniref:MAU2 chromatid cohesion factor homolog n=1 Tax=Orbicella faveolata TaxID=48498 RepID=UPI0009E61954|nr:MAU2 chromatid cohesion factor homolog [Orbicella faveolata]